LISFAEASQIGESRQILYSQLDKVVVSAKRVQTKENRSAEAITVITEEDIKKLPARDLTEVLSYVSGVDTSLAGQFGHASSLSIRGSASRQVLLMVDGIPFNTQLSGQANPSRIPIENIKQIEIIKGASSSAWGSAIGGVINVITKDPVETEALTGSFTSQAGEFETIKEGLELSGTVKNLGYYVSGSFFKTEGHLESTDVEEIKGFGKLTYPLGDQAKITGSFGYSSADVTYGITPSNRVLAQPYISRYGQMNINIDKDIGHFSVAYKYNDQDVTGDTYNATTGALVFGTVSNNFYQGVSLNSHFEIDDDLLVIGADFDWHTLKSSNFLSESIDIATQAPYVNYTWVWNNWDFIPGFRYDNNERFGSQLSPSMGIIYYFEDDRNTLVRVKASQAFNAPALLWLFNDDPAFFVGPNPDLKAERANVYEIGLETQPFEPIVIEFNAYRSDVKDAISTVFTGGLFVQQNFRKFRRQGLELIVNYKINKDLTITSSGAFNDVENRQTRETVRDSGIARQSYKVGVQYAAPYDYHIYLSGYYNRWSSSNSLQPNDRKFLLDAKVVKKFLDSNGDSDLELFLNIYNVTNSSYWSSITFPLPRRYFEGGVTLKF